MTRETYCPEQMKGLEVISVKNKTIVLPFEETTYEDIFADKTAYKAFITEQMRRHPE